MNPDQYWACAAGARIAAQAGVAAVILLEASFYWPARSHIGEGHKIR